MRKLLLYGYVTHTKIQKKPVFHNTDFSLHENNARSLTKPTSLWNCCKGTKKVRISQHGLALK